MHFWKEYNIYDCIKNQVTKECMNGIWKKTLKRFIHDFRGTAKDEEVARLRLRWLATLTWVWMRMTLGSS